MSLEQQEFSNGTLNPVYNMGMRDLQQQRTQRVSRNVIQLFNKRHLNEF